MKTKIEKKKIILWVLLGLTALCLFAVGVLCFLQSIQYYGKLDREMQLEQFGFYKSDISLLTHQQHISEALYGIAGAFSILGAVAIIFSTIVDIVGEAC